MKKLKAVEHFQEYFKNLEKDIYKTVDFAKKARKTGRDICEDIECVPAPGIAEKTEVLVGPKGVAKKYNELWEKYKNREKVVLKIFDLILDKKLGNIEEPEKRLDQAIRTALVILTEGVVVSPLDGIPEIKIAKNSDGSKFVDIYFAGPIRAAGGTGQTWPLLLADYARKKLHLDKFKPTKKEINRIVEEVNIYQEEVVTRQLRISEEEIRVIAKNCPISINSGPDSNVEVIANRDIDRIPTNRIRGAMCLVLIDGVFVRKKKILKISKKLGLDWSWLEKIIKAKKTSEGSFELKPNFKYLEGLAAGRPVFSYPCKPGGFRLRYGKTRNTGLMAKAIHPSTMYTLDSFTAVGTHGKIERPGKSLQFFPCTSIDPPIVKLSNEDVVELEDPKFAKKIHDEIQEILFLGDILISIGDFRKSGHPLVKTGYVEEEWIAEMEYLYKKEKINKKIYKKAKELNKNCNPFKAINFSLEYDLPLYPKYILFYDLLNKEDLKILIREFRNGKKVFDNNKIKNLILDYNKDLKNILEKLLLPHKYNKFKKEIIIEEKYAYVSLKTIGALNAKNPLDEFKKEFKDQENILDLIKTISKIEVRNKSGTYIGTRMGRPEAAHERMMKGKPNVLFPIGHGFGNNRDIIKASQKKSNKAKPGEYGINKIQLRAYQCPKCKKIKYHSYCFNCKCKTKLIRYCKKCKRQMYDKVCPYCKEETIPKIYHKVNLDKLLKQSSRNLKVGLPEKLKTVKGLVSGDKIPEPLEKGILRAKHDVYVFRDGTSRYEALNATISQFKGEELNLDLEKLKELGYTKDYKGQELKSNKQICDLYPQDIIIDERCARYFLKVSRYIDDLLEKFYGIEKFYNCKNEEDLIGHLVIGLAPHTSAGIVGRIIGFSKSKLGWGHPFYITAKRRNVDGDQDSSLLLLDGLLNFSEKYLSKGRGGRMDAPLSFTTILNPYEVDDESHEMEVVEKYPYELYKASKQNESADLKCIKFVTNILGTKEQYNSIKFTHNTKIFDQGPKESAYKSIKNMVDKVDKQAKLQKRIKGVDEKDALERLLHYHFFPDIIGNTRGFARQKLRCVKCNAKYRRIPLSGKCENCGGKLILTIAEGSIKKYIGIAEKIIKDYDLKNYLNQRIELSKQEIDSLFFNEEDRNQKSLSDFF